MRDYEELIKSLRLCGRLTNTGDKCVASHDGCCEAEPICMYELMRKAADAIEELSKYSGLESKAMDYAEDFMIFLAERRDAKGTEKQEVMVCNTLWWACKLVYDFLTLKIKRERMRK